MISTTRQIAKMGESCAPAHVVEQRKERERPRTTRKTQRGLRPQPRGRQKNQTAKK